MCRMPGVKQECCAEASHKHGMNCIHQRAAIELLYSRYHVYIDLANAPQIMCQALTSADSVYLNYHIPPFSLLDIVHVPKQMN